MIRTQVQLDESQVRRLRRLAAEQRVSVAALIRDAVDRYFVDRETGSRRERAVASIGGYHSGQSDVAVDHDRYLGDDFR